MTSREQECVDHAECCESLRRALCILRDIRGVDPRTAVHDAAFHFAVVEYAKPYASLQDAQKRRMHPCRPAPPSNLPSEDLALHRKIMALRNQLLAQSELTLENAITTTDGAVSHTNIPAQTAPPLPLDIDAVVGLIERSLEAMALEKDDLLKSLNTSRARTHLTARIVKITIQATGTLAALLGLCALAMTGFTIYHSIVERDPAPIALGFFLLGIGLYLIYFAYLALFEYSPLTVRHLCGLLAFLAIGPVQKLFDPLDNLRHLRPSGWTAFAFLACLAAFYSTYRFASARLSRFLFPQKA